MAVVIALGACGSRHAQTPGDDAALRAMQAINAGSEAAEAKFDRLSAAWETAFGAAPAGTASRSDEGLRDAFAATDMVLFYAILVGDRTADAWLDRLRDIHAALEARGGADPVQSSHLFDAFVTLRRMDEAQALRVRTKSLSQRVLPIVHPAPDFDASLPATMALREDGAWHVTNRRTDDAIVIVAGCPTSAEAMRALRESPSLMGRLREFDVIWLADAATLAADPESIAAWNREFPDQPLQIAWRNDAWPGVRFESMPGFHYFRSGQRVRRHEGWDNARALAEVRAAVDALVSGEEAPD